MSIRRLPVAVTAGVAAALALAAAAPAINPVVGGPRRDRTPIIGTTILDPSQHLFGDIVRARIQLIVDGERADPETLKMKVSFGAYRQVSPMRLSRTESGQNTLLVYEYRIACLTARCLPKGVRNVGFPSVEVTYVQLGVAPKPLTISLPWQPLRVAGRLDPLELDTALPRAEIRDLPAATYRFAPRTIAIVGGILAAVFTLGAAFLILRWLPLGRLTALLGLKRVDRRSALERALALAQKSAESGRPEEGRRALERVAVELRRAKDSELAQAASQLAWSADRPIPAGVGALSDDVRRRISENGH